MFEQDAILNGEMPVSQRTLSPTFTLIDLAGSEKLVEQRIEAQTCTSFFNPDPNKEKVRKCKEETIHINKSLLEFGKVIRGLSEAKEEDR